MQKIQLILKRKKMLPLAKKELKSHENAIECYICGKVIQKNPKDINSWKNRNHCHYTEKYRSAVHSICNLKFKVSYKIPEVFHNGLNYDYYFIIKELANELEGQVELLGKNKEKCKGNYKNW